MPVVNVATAIPGTRSVPPEMLRRRVITAVIAVLVLAVVLFGLPTMAARAVIALLMLGAAWEWSGFIFKDMHIGRYLYVVFIGLLMAAVYSQLPDAELVDVIFRIALGWWLAALAWTFYYPTPILPAIAWICGVLVIGPAWLALDFLYLTAADLLLFALLIVWIADIGAYFVGKGFGRVKLAPQVSPGKTWEGALGGLCAVTILAALGSLVLDIEIAVLVPFCVAVAMVSIVGDLTVSMFKRNAGLKDSGTLFPGHGGILDRIDSVAAAAPLFALALGWIGLR